MAGTVLYEYVFEPLDLGLGLTDDGSEHATHGCIFCVFSPLFTMLNERSAYDFITFSSSLPGLAGLLSILQ